MASPGSVGTTLADAAADTTIGERDAIKLAFNDTGTVLNQQDLPRQTLPTPIAAAIGWGSAYVVGDLPGLAVPNTLANPLDRDYGQTFDVTAVAISGSLATPDEEDFYAITGHAGEVMSFEVISTTDTLNPRPFLSELDVLDASGQRLAYNGSPQGAYSVRDIESNDPALIDVELPADGTYYVGVDALLSLSAGDYRLFMYSFATAPDPSGGNTLVGGGGNDTLVAGTCNDYMSFLPGSVGNATVVGGSGDDLVDLYPASRENVTGTGHFTIRRPTTSPKYPEGGIWFNVAPDGLKPAALAPLHSPKANTVNRKRWQPSKSLGSLRKNVAKTWQTAEKRWQPSRFPRADHNMLWLRRWATTRRAKIAKCAHFDERRQILKFDDELAIFEIGVVSRLYKRALMRWLKPT